MICPNCGKEGSHFAPPSMGEEGFYICDSIVEAPKKVGVIGAVGASPFVSANHLTVEHLCELSDMAIEESKKTYTPPEFQIGHMYRSEFLHHKELEHIEAAEIRDGIQLYKFTQKFCDERVGGDQEAFKRMYSFRVYEDKRVTHEYKIESRPTPSFDFDIPWTNDHHNNGYNNRKQQRSNKKKNKASKVSRRNNRRK